MKQGRTMIQLVGKPPTESTFCYEFVLLSLGPVADKGDHSNRLHQLVARSSIKEFLLKRRIKVWWSFSLQDVVLGSSIWMRKKSWIWLLGELCWWKVWAWGWLEFEVRHGCSVVVCNLLGAFVRQNIKQDGNRMLCLELVFGHQLATFKRFVPGERYSSDA